MSQVMPLQTYKLIFKELNTEIIAPFINTDHWLSLKIIIFKFLGMKKD